MLVAWIRLITLVVAVAIAPAAQETVPGLGAGRVINGCVQWWPARIATPSQSSTWATSWGWIPSMLKETIPARRSGGGP